MNNDEDNTHLDKRDLDNRMKNLMKRIPNAGKDEFLSDMEVYAEVVYSPDEPSEAGILGRILPTIFGILLIAVVIFLKLGDRPVSLKTLLHLHTQNKVTRNIMVAHMYSKPFGEAIKPLIEHADAGNMHAQNMTCWAHMRGFNVDVNLRLAEEYCHMAAGQGHSGAHANLGVLYTEYPSYVNIKKAIHHFEIAAEDRTRSALALSKIYETYPAPIRNFEKAVHYKTMAADKGEKQAMISLGNSYFKGELGLTVNYDKALEYFDKAQKAGSIDGDAFLGMFYMWAPAPFQDYEKSIYHFHSALRLHEHSMAFTHLGDAYRQGFGVEKNIKTAIKFYSYSVENRKKGHQYSAYWLAKLFEQGEIKPGERGYGFKYDGVVLPYIVKYSMLSPQYFIPVMKVISDETTDPLVVSKIYQYYADRINGIHQEGDVPLEMITMMHFAKGHNENFQPIVNALKRTASVGDPEHAYTLGKIYMSGGGVVRNPRASLDWISKAMDLRYPDKLDYVGITLSRSDEEGLRETQYGRDLLQKAANLGSAKAAESLGNIYSEGAGVEVNKIAAMYWYAHADRGEVAQGDVIYELKKNMKAEDVLRAETLIDDCQKSQFMACLSQL